MNTFNPASQQVSAARRTSKLAIWSFVLGLLFVVPYVSTLALVLGVSALIVIHYNAGTLTGRWWAIAGSILGGIGVLMWPVALLALQLATAPLDVDTAYAPWDALGPDGGEAFSGLELSVPVAVDSLFYGVDDYQYEREALPASLDALADVYVFGPLAEALQNGEPYQGYTFAYAPGADGSGFTVTATPVVEGDPVYVIDQTGMLLRDGEPWDAYLDEPLADGEPVPGDLDAVLGASGAAPDAAGAVGDVEVSGDLSGAADAELNTP